MMNATIKRTNLGTSLAACAAAAVMLAGCDASPRTPPEPTREPPAAVHHHKSEAKHHGSNADNPHVDQTEQTGAKSTAASVPKNVMTVLRHIDEHHKAPEGYEGGREFHNAGATAEKGLPRRDADGKAIAYHEWDVHPRQQGVNRGAERLVTGSDGSAYFTADHYHSFTKIR